jgi:hypothetical protein
VTHLPSGKFNLFSLKRKMQKHGLLLYDDQKKIWLMKDSQTVTFDMVIPTSTKGLLFAMYFKRGTEIAGGATDKYSQRMSVDEAHNKFGHSDVWRCCTKIGLDLKKCMYLVATVPSISIGMKPSNNIAVVKTSLTTFFNFLFSPAPSICTNLTGSFT